MKLKYCHSIETLVGHLARTVGHGLYPGIEFVESLISAKMHFYIVT